MSGLSGVRAFSASGIAWDALEEMAAVQRHRGPDGSQSWVGTDVGLAHARLGAPPETSRQPVHSADGRWVLVLDGTLLNGASLRSYVGHPLGHPLGHSPDHASRAHDDAEVVVAGLALEGISFVERLQGRFALVAHDVRTDTTHLVRDRVGMVPLHYRHVPGGIAFASEVKALLVLGPPPQVDHRSLDAYLAHRAVPAPDTLFEGVKKVRPAHRVAIMPGGHVEEVAWWSPPEADPEGTWTAGDAIEAVGDGLREAVRSALDPGARVGVHLIGDLASSLVTAEAQYLRGDEPVHTFSLSDPSSSPGAAAGGAEWPAHVARLLGTQHHDVRLRPGHLADLWAPLTWHRDAPLSDPADLIAHAVARAAREHVDTIATGHGAEELFGGHPRYRLARLAERSSTLPGRLGSGLAHTVERRLGATFSAPERLRLLGGAPPDERRSTPTMGADPVDRMLRHDLRHVLPDDVLERMDRMSAAASMDVRVPLLDHRLVELAFRLPTSVKVRSGCTMWVLREAARPLLPDTIVERRGAGAPGAASWYGGAYGGLRDTARRRLTGPDSWVAQNLDQALVRDLLLRHEHGAQEQGRLWALLALEVWHECYFGDAPRIPRPRSAAQPVIGGAAPLAP